MKHDFIRFSFPVLYHNAALSVYLFRCDCIAPWSKIGISTASVIDLTAFTVIWNDLRHHDHRRRLNTHRKQQNKGGGEEESV